MLRIWNCERPEALRQANLAGFSGALSHFVCLRPRKVLFDLGDGVATRLEPEIARLKHVFVSHAHDDHLLGLRGIAIARSVVAPGEAQRLVVHVPATDFAEIQSDLTSFARWSRFDWESAVELRPIFAERTVDVESHHRVEPFDADHLPGGASFGFRLIEKRKRLQSRWKGLESSELAALRQRVPDEEVHEPYDFVEFVYSGDTPRCPVSFALGARILWHEATFLVAEDRDLESGRHAVLEDVVRLAKECEAENLVLTHVSRRYRESAVCAAIGATLREVGYDRPTFWLRGSFDLPVD